MDLTADGGRGVGWGERVKNEAERFFGQNIWSTEDLQRSEAPFYYPPDEYNRGIHIGGLHRPPPRRINNLIFFIILLFRGNTVFAPKYSFFSLNIKKPQEKQLLCAKQLVYDKKNDLRRYLF